MALSMNFDYKGMPVTNGYIRLAHTDGNKNKMYFNVQYYVNKTLSDLDQQNNRPDNALIISGMYSIVPDLTSEFDIYAQMYIYLKTLTEFENASDA